MKSSTDKLNQAIERMTTGAKINHAKDNAANYSIATNMTTKINAYQVAEDNCAMGLDLISTASSSLEQMSDLTSRLRALATQAQNGTYGNQSLEALNTEAQAIVQELSRIKNDSVYNGISLLAGSAKVDTPSPISSYALQGRAVGVTEADNDGFIQKVNRRDTSAMTTLASVDENTKLTSGTYSISTAEELAKLATMTNNGKIGSNTEFVLANNIDLSAYSTGEGWTPIGSEASKFTATFDGNGYVVSNLYINRPDKDYQGLFGYLENANIKNIAVVNCEVTGKNYVGGLAGIEHGTVSNCYATGNITGTSGIGGLIGCAYGITNSYATCTVTGTDKYIGGLVGLGRYAAISNSYATGKVTGNNITGGLAGNASYGKISNSYATGNTTGSDAVGGLIGNAKNTTLDNVYFTDTTGQTVGIGNLIPASGTANLVTMTKLHTLIAQGVLPDYRQKSAVSATDFSLQIGIGSNSASQISFSIDPIDISAITGIDLTDTYTLQSIDNFLATINAQQTKLGAVQNRLESALGEISTQYDNLVSSRSTIQDADIAEVSSEYIKMQILQQASATLMATANQSPSIALQLL